MKDGWVHNNNKLNNVKDGWAHNNNKLNNVIDWSTYNSNKLPNVKKQTKRCVKGLPKSNTNRRIGKRLWVTLSKRTYRKELNNLILDRASSTKDFRTLSIKRVTPNKYLIVFNKRKFDQKQE